jgi:hypothetical protein
LDKYLKKQLDSIVKRYKTIHHPALCLAFVLDPALSSMRDGETNSTIGGFDVMHEARTAIDDMCRNNDNYDAAECLSEFCTFIRQDTSRSSDTLMHPLNYWSLQRSYRNLRKIAVDVFALPSSAAGGERSFKSMKKQHTKERKKMDDHKVVQATAVHFNSKQLKRKSVLGTRKRLSRLTCGSIFGSRPSTGTRGEEEEGRRK